MNLHVGTCELGVSLWVDIQPMQDEGCRDERPPTTIFLAVVFHGDLVRKVDVLILRASLRSPLLRFKLWRRSPGSMSWNAVKCESWLRQSGFHNSSGQILGDARGGALPKTEHASNRTRHRRKNALLGQKIES